MKLVSPSECENIADLKAAFDGAKMIDGHRVYVADLNSSPAGFRWAAGHAAAGDDQLIVTPTTGAASGRWVRSDPFISLKLPYVYNQANNTALITIPTGLRFGIIKTGLQIGTQFAGADTGSIGIDSNISLNPGGLGLIVGGTGLAVNTYAGSQGAEVNTPQRSMLTAGDVIRHNILVAGYTGGTGFWHVMGTLFQT